MATRFRLNGKMVSADADNDTPLLYVLRNDFGLNSPRFGCGKAQCGSCRVIVGGEAVPSCIVRLADVAGADVETLEGIGSTERLHPLQQAFLTEQAAQCGYCTAGIIMAAKALLDANPDPTETEVRYWLAGNLCRCTGYDKIIRAVMDAAADLRQVRV